MEVEATGSRPPENPKTVAVPAIEHPHMLSRRSALAEFAELLLVTMLLALFGTTFVVQAFKIPSPSMEPTLLIGDHVFVNKFIFGGRGAWYEKFLPYRAVRRGDVIVFKFPFEDHPHYVKRVIGLPGDRIRIINGDVWVNGSRLNEPYVVHDPTYEDPFGDNFPPSNRDIIEIAARREWADQIVDHVQDGELVVPPNHYFVLGDNRDRSLDSRYWGFVDRDAIMGRPILIYWSVQATSQDYSDRGMSGTLRGIGETFMHLPSRTRWHRMFHEVH